MVLLRNNFSAALLHRRFLFPLLVAITSACTTHSSAPLRKTASVINDPKNLLCTYAPVILNERQMGTPEDFSSHPIMILADYAETSTHAYLNYTVVKAFSAFNVLSKPLTNRSLMDFDGHFMDTEDLFLVLKKIPPVNGDASQPDYEPVFFTSNVHGETPYYFFKNSNVVESERLARTAETLSMTSGPWDNYQKNSTLSNKLQKNKLNLPLPIANVLGRPLVVSKFSQHSLIGVDVIAARRRSNVSPKIPSSIFCAPTATTAGRLMRSTRVFIQKVCRTT